MTIDLVNLILGFLVIFLVLGMLLDLVGNTGYPVMFLTGTVMSILNMIKTRSMQGQFLGFAAAAAIMLIFTILSFLYTGGNLVF